MDKRSDRSVVDGKCKEVLLFVDLVDRSVQERERQSVCKATLRVTSDGLFRGLNFSFSLVAGGC